eukprot:TRINITY_DN22093_c0_g1_i5.p1 TRINITY_DN22093_c0_g1~~TRINITY_DN22093_c0_g1_i5.p1  ORF type:complete len:987 (+),score=239.39 TRINITY_DN22093_c0_g1_i5:773-3733(+)
MLRKVWRTCVESCKHRCEASRIESAQKAYKQMQKQHGQNVGEKLLGTLGPISDMMGPFAAWASFCREARAEAEHTKAVDELRSELEAARAAQLEAIHAGEQSASHKARSMELRLQMADQQQLKKAVLLEWRRCAEASLCKLLLIGSHRVVAEWGWRLRGPSRRLHAVFLVWRQLCLQDKAQDRWKQMRANVSNWLYSSRGPQEALEQMFYQWIALVAQSKLQAKVLGRNERVVELGWQLHGPLAMLRRVLPAWRVAVESSRAEEWTARLQSERSQEEQQRLQKVMASAVSAMLQRVADPSAILLEVFMTWRSMVEAARDQLRRNEKVAIAVERGWKLHGPLALLPTILLSWQRAALLANSAVMASHWLMKSTGPRKHLEQAFKAWSQATMAARTQADVARQNRLLAAEIAGRLGGERGLRHLLPKIMRVWHGVAEASKRLLVHNKTVLLAVERSWKLNGPSRLLPTIVLSWQQLASRAAATAAIAGQWLGQSQKPRRLLERVISFWCHLLQCSQLVSMRESCTGSVALAVSRSWGATRASGMLPVLVLAWRQVVAEDKAGKVLARKHHLAVAQLLKANDGRAALPSMFRAWHMEIQRSLEVAKMERSWWQAEADSALRAQQLHEAQGSGERMEQTMLRVRLWRERQAKLIADTLWMLRCRTSPLLDVVLAWHQALHKARLSLRAAELESVSGGPPKEEPLEVPQSQSLTMEEKAKNLLPGLEAAFSRREDVSPSLVGETSAALRRMDQAMHSLVAERNEALKKVDMMSALRLRERQKLQARACVLLRKVCGDDNLTSIVFLQWRQEVQLEHLKAEYRDRERFFAQSIQPRRSTVLSLHLAGALAQPEDPTQLTQAALLGLVRIILAAWWQHVVLTQCHLVKKSAAGSSREQVSRVTKEKAARLHVVKLRVWPAFRAWSEEMRKQRALTEVNQVYAPAAACECGAVFLTDSAFCRICGAERHYEKQEVPESLPSFIWCIICGDRSSG